MSYFTLTVAASSDGYISPDISTPTHTWVSSEEQVLFFRDIEAADWTIMGRHTHEAADRPDRRRIIFSSKSSGWQRPTQIWLNPEDLTPTDLPERVEHIRPLKHGVILGGTRVHDWFLANGAIDQVNLTIEPVSFADGLPVFSDQAGSDPLEIFRVRGFEMVSHEVLNSAGTQFVVLKPLDPRGG